VPKSAWITLISLRAREDGGEAVAAVHVASTLFLIPPAASVACMKQPAQLTGGHRLAAVFSSAGKEPTLLHGDSPVSCVTDAPSTKLPATGQCIRARSMNIAILAGLGLLEFEMIVCALSICFTFNPHYLRRRARRPPPSPALRRTADLEGCWPTARSLLIHQGSSPADLFGSRSREINLRPARTVEPPSVTANSHSHAPRSDPGAVCQMRR